MSLAAHRAKEKPTLNMFIFHKALQTLQSFFRETKSTEKPLRRPQSPKVLKSIQVGFATKKCSTSTFRQNEHSTSEIHGTHHVVGLRLSDQDQYVGADNGQAEVQQDDGSLGANVPAGRKEKESV